MSSPVLITPHTSFWKRSIGLMGRKSLAYGQGIVLSPCTHIHTFFMRFPISVLHCDREGKLIKYVPILKPWSWSFCASSYYVFELNAGYFADTEQVNKWLVEYFYQNNP